ncbi:hypothetical protein [Compostibacter hankyongensis]|uniref:Zinc-finger domain-containing protein n=1 Tax=Compostibacter hankyongensis TaxID=1007089 RepID=A0ABP8FQI2_9BACT
MQTASTIAEQLLNAFTPVHCLSQQQLLQYVGQKMPAVEQHMVEQHLVDCPLCSTALEVMLQPEKQAALSPLLQEVHAKIRFRYQTAPEQKKRHQAIQQKARLIKKEQKTEVFLKYGWIIVFALIGTGFAFWIASRPAVATRPAVSEALPAGGTADPATEAATTLPEQPDPAPKTNLVATAARRNTESAGNKPTKAPAGDTSHVVRTPPAALPAAPVKKPAPDSSRQKAVAPAVKREEEQRQTAPPGKQDDSLQRPPATTPQHPREKPASNPKPSLVNQPEIAGSSEKSIAPSPSLDEMAYTRAKKLMGQGDWKAAVDQLEPLSRNSGRFHETANYQMAVCYKAMGRKGKARRILKNIVKENGNMKEQASQLLSAL